MTFSVVKMNPFYISFILKCTTIMTFKRRFHSPKSMNLEIRDVILSFSQVVKRGRRGLQIFLIITFVLRANRRT